MGPRCSSLGSLPKLAPLQKGWGHAMNIGLSARQADGLVCEQFHQLQSFLVKYASWEVSCRSSRCLICPGDFRHLPFSAGNFLGNATWLSRQVKRR